MTVELTAEEVALVIRALQEHAVHRRAQGLSADQADGLVRRLEGQQVKAAAPALPAPGEAPKALGKGRKRKGG